MAPTYDYTSSLGGLALYLLGARLAKRAEEAIPQHRVLTHVPLGQAVVNVVVHHLVDAGRNVGVVPRVVERGEQGADHHEGDDRDTVQPTVYRNSVSKRERISSSGTLSPSTYKVAYTYFATSTRLLIRKMGRCRGKSHGMILRTREKDGHGL